MKLFTAARLILISALLAVSSAASATEETDLEKCYKKATTEASIQECLRMELKNVRSEYRAVLEQVQSDVSGIDRVRGSESSANAFKKANVAFDRYVSEQCEFEEALHGEGSGAEASNLSCQINLLNWRMGLLESVMPR